MNGKTTVDEILNPCMAEMDRHTYGWNNLNISIYGNRLLRIGILQVYLDFFWWKLHKPMYCRMNDGVKIFFPGGSISWLKKR